MSISACMHTYVQVILFHIVHCCARPVKISPCLHFASGGIFLVSCAHARLFNEVAACCHSTTLSRLLAKFDPCSHRTYVQDGAGGGVGKASS